LKEENTSVVGFRIKLFLSSVRTLHFMASEATTSAPSFLAEV